MPLSSDDRRRSRYERVLASICAHAEFTDTEIKLTCHEEHGGFVNRVLKQLTSEGFLQSRSGGPRTSYVWVQDPGAFSPASWIDRQIHGTQIKQTPADERPRERLLRCGPAALRTAELLAILIRTGRPGESALEAGERLANRTGTALELLRNMAPAEMKQISPAISSSAYCQIAAGIELGRRVVASLQRDREIRIKVDSPTGAVLYCQQHFERLARDRQQEEFHIVCLDTKLRPIGQHQVFVGTLDTSLIHPREVFRPAIKDAASAIILVHNHPSGDPTPSREDGQVTDRLCAAGDLLGIQVLDHVVVAARGCVSLSEYRR